jgi:hypothetical protein
MSGSESPLLVLLASGESVTKAMRFLPGQATQPITIGREGVWRVDGNGVAPTHLRLAFDGRQLHVCTLGESCPAAINGAPIDARWWPVQAPCEIQFGGACLRVIAEQQARTPAPRPDPTELLVGSGLQKPPPMTGTVLDGSGRWFAEHGPAQQAQAVKAISGAPGPSGPPPRAPVASPTPDHRVPAAAPVMPTLAVAATPTPAPAGGPVAPSRAPAGRSDMTVLAPLGPEQAPARAPARTPFLGLEGVRASPTPPPTAHGPAANFAAGGGSGTPPPPYGTAAAPPGLLGAAAGKSAPLVQPSAMPPAAHHRTPAPQWNQFNDPGPELPAAPTTVVKGVANLWSATSPVMKAVIVLLPIAAGFAFKSGLFDEEPPAATTPSRAATSSTHTVSSARAIAENAAVKPQPSVAQPTSVPARPIPSAARPGPSAAVADPTAASSAAGNLREPEPARSVAAASPPDTPAKRNGSQPRTQQRDAIDAAFSGSFEEAAALYDQLAASQPNEPAFREAARILREKSQRAR